MKLSNLHVLNYRGLKDTSIPLSPFVCITGENNAGKSSLLQALSLFLSGSSLKPTDYFDASQEIIIRVKISDITAADLLLLADEHRERIEGLLDDGCLTLVRRYETNGKSQFGYFGLVPKDPRFIPDTVSALLSGKRGSALVDAVSVAFPELSEQLTASTTQAAAKELVEQLGNSLPADEKKLRFKPLPTGFDKSITPMLPERIYIPAVKDFNDDTKTAESSPFGKILAIVMRSIEPLLAQEADIFRNLSKKLTRVPGEDGEILDERLPLLSTIEEMIQRYVRESFSNISLEIDIPPPELKTVLSTANILADDGIKGPLELKGDGLRRAVVFSILRSYVELARSSVEDGTVVEGQSERGYLLLFEEPELFLHPDAQKILFNALGVFSEKNHVVVTTHSPLFLSPKALATFIRLSKERKPDGNKPYTKALHVDLTGFAAKDEFQIICYENNSAAFFAKRIVLVEGDSDYIAFPHIAETLNEEWNCLSHSVAFVRVGGKGSIARYRKFFEFFEVPVFVIGDLDCLLESFDKLDPSKEAKTIREQLLQITDSVIDADGGRALPKSNDIGRAQTRTDLRGLWDAVRAARIDYEADKSNFAQLDAAVDSFFSWEKKNLRRDLIQNAKDTKIKAAKLSLIWELRKNRVFVLERGALDDYYPSGITGDKPSKAQSFIALHDTREKILPLSPKQVCPVKKVSATEFEFICSAIFGELNPHS
ncbi:ATP-dependent endonuclease [bacterium]|nr:ATP-dependent endonuclease [bacterium]